MTNKEKLKSAINKDINTVDYYNKIMGKIKKQKNNFNLYKLSFVSIFLFIISGILYLNLQNKNSNIHKEDLELDRLVNLNINELTSVYNETEKLDLVESTNIYLPFKGDAIIPKDLTYSYTNTNTINSDSEDKILSNYIIEYTNGSDRNIKILYSYNTNFSNDYLYDIDSKITTINGIDLKIYKYKYMYFIKFKPF